MSGEMQRPAAAGKRFDTEDPTARINSVIDGRYRLTELIGQGGMGAVYRGEHTTIRRPVAVKLLHPELAQLPELVHRFEREAYAIGRIDHPNCVTISDFGHLDDGSVYLVMEYLQGETLGELLDRERMLDPLRAIHLTRHVVRGLRHAHHSGIVHRDVKPDNVVLVNLDGDPDFAKILDFGIAKLIGSAESHEHDKLTQAGIAFGTPTYISPEQAMGDGAEPRSDLYSATVMLFEMLTGSPPFRADDKLELLAMHASRKPPLLADAAPGRKWPKELEATIQRGLGKRAVERFANADEFLEDLDKAALALGAPSVAPTQWPVTGPFEARALSTEEIRERSVLGDYRRVFAAVDPNKKKKLLAAVGGALLLIVLGFAVAGDKGAPEASAPPPGAVADEATDESILRAAEKSLNRGSPAETIELIESQERADGDAKAQLQLGHAYSVKSDYPKAIGAYRLALELEPDLIIDPTLRTNLQLMIDGDGPVFVDAAALLIVHHGGEAVKERLVELASAKDMKTRHAALALAEKLGLGGRVDRVRSFSWDLTQRKTCEGRRDAVSSLRALGDPQAIPALEKARARSGGSRWRRNRPNACLAQAATDAITFLKSQPGGH